MPAKKEDNGKKEEKKGKEPWRYKVVSGSEHPDHKPPVTVIAEASEEAAEKEEASINADREKLYGPKPDWAELPGGRPPGEEEDDVPEPGTKHPTPGTKR